MENYFFCKYGGIAPKCSDCKRNHINSEYKTEEIDTWYAPFHNGSVTYCEGYISINEQEYKIKGWVARDKNMILTLFLDKPQRNSFDNTWTFGGDEVWLNQNFFPDLTWEDEPIEVELTIKVIECVNGEI